MKRLEIQQEKSSTDALSEKNNSSSSSSRSSSYMTSVEQTHYHATLKDVSLSSQDDAKPKPLQKQAPLEAPETGDVFLGVEQLRAGSVTIAKEKELGHGAFGNVYKGTWQQRPVAIKEIDIERAQKNLGIDRSQVLDALSWEMARLASTSHPNLVQFYGAYQEQDKTYLVLEFCEGGSLQDALKKNPSWALRWQWALQMSQGLAYLHHQGTLHRDLKAENILLPAPKLPIFML
jgi:hypothetical protein